MSNKKSDRTLTERSFVQFVKFARYLFVVFLGIAVELLPASTIDSLRGAFKDPPVEFTQIPFWFWNHDISEEGIRRQLEDFKTHGVHGFVPHARMGLSRDVGYMTTRWLELIRYAVQEAERLDMKVILYDEGMYPSGSAHGEVVRDNPAFASQGLRMESVDVIGSKKGFKKLFRVEANERIVGIMAGRWDQDSEQIISSTLKNLGPSNPVQYDFPAGQWKLMAFIQTPSGGVIRGVHYGEEDSDPGAPPSADLLNPEATAKFIRATHERYYESVGEYFGSVVIAMFTDEPGVLGRRSKKGLKPWTTGLKEHFQEKTGYDPVPWLPLLFFKDDTDMHVKFNRDMAQVLADRLNESFYKPLSDWCAEHDIALTGHPAGPDDLLPQRYFQIPGQDVVWRGVLPGKTALESKQSMNGKGASSAARHWKRRWVLDECYGAYGLRLTMSEMKWLADWLFVRGVNLLSPHAFYYSVEGDRLYERPPDVGPNNLWWDHYRSFSDYTDRLSWLMTDNRQICEVAMFAECNAFDYRAAKVLFQNQIDFNYLDESVCSAADLENPENLKNGLFKVADQVYKLIILDHVETMSDRGMDYIRIWLGNGIPVILYSDSQPPWAANLRHANLLRCSDESSLLRTLKDHLFLDVFAEPIAPDLRTAHIRKGRVDFYICVNEGEEIIDTKLFLNAMGEPEIWDAEDGSMREAKCDYHKDGRTSVQLTLYPRQSKIIAFLPFGQGFKNNADGQYKEDILILKLSENWELVTPDQKIIHLEELANWTELDDWSGFSGTMDYRCSFSLSDAYLRTGRTFYLDLGQVREFAEVSLNSRSLGVRLWPPFHFKVPSGQLKEQNLLHVHVTNTLENQFGREILPSGLTGPVRLAPTDPAAR